MKDKNYSKIINEILTKYSSGREFAKMIGEEASDVSRWRYGKLSVSPRAVISICRLHKNISPHQLNSAVFPEDVKLTFTKEKK